MTNRKCAPLEAIPKALEKTGFLLEHAVSEEFRSAGWTVISHRYYVDDVGEKARELDLLAYRASKSDELDVFTGVLVSCKKDAEHTWAFLSKDKPSYDPNLDWEPVHCWSDCEPLVSYLDSCEWKKSYVHANESVYSSTFRTTRNVFAFQLISPNGTAPKNDKAIFDSITGLLKALDHELSVLPGRAKEKKRVYLFTLVTVVDAPLVDVQYRGQQGTAIEVDKLLHLARYMVRKRELSAHVHFVRSDKIKDFIGSMSALAEHNSSHMISLVSKSYEAVRTSKKVQSYFAKKLELKLRWRLNFALRDLGISDKVTSLQLSYSNETLNVELDVDEDSANALNSDPKTREQAKKALLEIARYEGDFLISSDMPF